MKPYLIYDKITGLLFVDGLASFQFTDDIYRATRFADFMEAVAAMQAINFWAGRDVVSVAPVPVSFWYSREAN